jgi:uncharacterized protein with PQ loop repeat
MLSNQETMQQFSFVWGALVISVIATLPQLWQVIQTNEARDFNTTSIVLSLVANTLIGAEAVRRGATATIVLTIWLLAYWAILLWYKLSPPPGIVLRNQVEGEY